jgi:hypothetical protein
MTVMKSDCQDLAEPEHFSIDIYADLRRPQAHAAARCDSS